MRRMPIIFAVFLLSFGIATYAQEAEPVGWSIGTAGIGIDILGSIDAYGKGLGQTGNFGLAFLEAQLFPASSGFGFLVSLVSADALGSKWMVSILPCELFYAFAKGNSWCFALYGKAKLGVGIASSGVDGFAYYGEAGLSIKYIVDTKPEWLYYRPVTSVYIGVSTRLQVLVYFQTDLGGLIASGLLGHFER